MRRLERQARVLTAPGFDAAIAIAAGRFEEFLAKPIEGAVLAALAGGA